MFDREYRGGAPAAQSRASLRRRNSEFRVLVLLHSADRGPRRLQDFRLERGSGANRHQHVKGEMDATTAGPFSFKEENRGSEIDRTLRPRRLDEFVGQDRVRGNLRIAIDAAKKRGEPLDHLLLSGLPGLGKTSLASVVAQELGVAIKITSGPALERTGDLVGLLTSMARGDVLFIDEIHRLPRVLEEYLYSAMEDLAIDIVIDQGPAARSVRLTVEAFTLIGATTREGLLTAPFRARFGLIEKLELYPPGDLLEILERSARLLRADADRECLERLAARARGTPRVANRLLRRVRDLAEVEGEGQGRLTVDVAERTLANLGIDAAGLEETDRKILRCIERSGGPVGIKTLAAAVGEEEDTIESVYEPYLLSIGFLNKSPRGRMLTEGGRRHLGTPPQTGQRTFL
jgi:Holliday junction DNA helicase RuvB